MGKITEHRYYIHATCFRCGTIYSFTALAINLDAAFKKIIDAGLICRCGNGTGFQFEQYDGSYLEQKG